MTFRRPTKQFETSLIHIILVKLARKYGLKEFSLTVDEYNDERKNHSDAGFVFVTSDRKATIHFFGTDKEEKEIDKKFNIDVYEDTE